MVTYLRNRAEESSVVLTILIVLAVCSLIVTVSYPIFLMTPFLIGGTPEMVNAGISAGKNTAPLWVHGTIWGISACITFICSMVSDD